MKNTSGVLVVKGLVSINEVHETPLVLKAAILEPNGSNIETFVIVYTCNPPWQVPIATTLPKTQTQGKATKPTVHVSLTKPS